MVSKIIMSICLMLGMAGASKAITNINIYADPEDGLLEVRDSLPPANPWPTIQDTAGWEMNVGEWYGPGLTTPVIPFQLPDFGPIADPFISADFGVMVHTIGGATITEIDLYAVRYDDSPLISPDDWYNGVGDSSAMLIQAGFLTPTSPAGFVGAPNNFTDSTGDANLLSYLNAVYDGGANAGKFVFLRLSYASNTLASGWDAYKMTSRNAGMVGEWPVITVAVDDTADSDGDGLPDLWEGANGLDPYDGGLINTNNGAQGDPDSDNLSNTNEFVYGTDPQNPDSDGDGLTDGFEVSSTNATSPTAWDSDGDGLSDGDEVNTHLTDPNKTDTDGDGEDDRLEVFQQTDPRDSASSSAALGLIVVDGVLDAAYGDAVSTQTVNTAWMDNLDELDAAYARVQNGRLFVMLTGNMNTNWNGLEIFIDSSKAVTTNVLETAGNDNTSNMDGLVFDEGFSPDFHMLFRVGPYNGFNFNVDFAGLETKAVTYHLNLFNGQDEGFGYIGAGDATSNSIAVAFTNSNTAGLVSGIDAALAADVLAVTNGLEFSVALEDLGESYGAIRMMAMVTRENHAVLSNQILGGLVPPNGELGTSNIIDFNDYIGNQYFTIPGRAVPRPKIVNMQISAEFSEIQLTVDELITGYDYVVQSAHALGLNGFSTVAGSEFIAVSTNDSVTIPADMTSDPKCFYRITAP